MSEKNEQPPAYEASERVAATETAAVSHPRPLRAPLPLDLPALNIIKGRRVVLASKSPRRKQLLAQIGLTQIDIVPSSFAEDLSKNMTPFEYVLQTATEKALDVYKREIDNVEKGEPAIIVAADTVVVGHWGEILEKPRSEKQHFEMLKMLRDHGRHQVVTAVACVAPLESALEPGYRLESAIEETSVQFDTQVTDELLLAYVRTREGVDKAGGYAIQGVGSILVERIEGSFDNVVGLPLRATLQLIEKTLTPESEDPDDLEGDA